MIENLMNGPSAATIPSASGLAPESADLEAPEEAPQGEDLQDTGGEPELE